MYATFLHKRVIKKNREIGQLAAPTRWFGVLQTLRNVVKVYLCKEGYFVKIATEKQQPITHPIMSLFQTDIAQTPSKTAPPKRYGVFLLNDHYTPMDFVVDILMDIFRLPEYQAEAVMLQIHHQGKGLCGSYTRDIAQTKQQQVMAQAVAFGHPLMCTIEELS